MISLKMWSEFLFDFWKFLKKYHGDIEHFKDAIKDAEALMEKHDQRIFQMIIHGMIAQECYESMLHAPKN